MIRSVRLRKPSVGSDEHVLGHVLGKVCVTNHPVGDADNHGIVQSKKRLEASGRWQCSFLLWVHLDARFQVHHLHSTDQSEFVTGDTHCVSPSRGPVVPDAIAELGSHQ